MILEKKTLAFIRWVAASIFLLAFASCAPALQFTKKPYLQHVTTQSIIICWETDEVSAGRIEYGATTELGGVADTTGFDTFHEVKLEGLEPDTRYYFKVEAEGLLYKGRFKTAPLPGTPFRFIVYGDFRASEIEMRMARKMLKEEPDLFVTVGDYLSDGSNPEYWPPLFRIIAPLIQKVPYYVTLGNHEKDGPLYFKYFAMPGNERWYSFDYGNSHFIALDSNMPYLLDPKQKKWLTDDLKAARKNPETSFIFVYFHHPPYGTGGRHGNPQVAGRWGPVYEKYRVDAVFCGHEHHYERNVVNGITYITSGGGGAGLYEFKYEEPYSVKRSMRYHYVVFDVGKGVVRAKAVALEGEVLDEFEFTSQAGK